ncbi:hypothetical protein GYMLUDRAFT_48077 [Collybiopsis luxurians FD-317 M1]|uniref:Decapping nuclease n=1 Tax=Collybiopsis luxurians FD-317 M1 TaxID=944289 RepID=A0A0D0BK96_9AGAR|nr:hypothetical protein GYMLUDRAFT_48077 [Collybiopsis luxurians FD-317 M1]
MSKRTISEVIDGTTPTEDAHTEIKRRLDSTATNSKAISRGPKLLSYPSLATQSSPPQSVPFQQPTPLISFSYTPEHILQFDESSLKYYHPPPPNAQLGYGYERWIRRPEERSRIDSLLEAVDRVTDPEGTGKDGRQRKLDLGDVGVVAWRGVVTRILTAPYEDRDRFDMNVMLVNGTLYLEEHRTEAQLKEKNNLKPQQRKMMYHGYAFESYCTTDTPSASSLKQPAISQSRRDPPGWGGDVNTNEQWCSVVRTKLGNTKIIIGGEVDCVQGQYKGTTDTFVELKTSMSIRGVADEIKFEKKLLKFYFQSFLLGVPKIVVGFRTPSGELMTTQSLQTIQLPRMVREKAASRGPSDANNIWNPSLCLAWCYNFLTYLRKSIREPEDDPTKKEDKSLSAEEANIEHPTLATSAAVWRVTFVPHEGARVTKLDRSAVEEVVNGEDRVGFLPSWYWRKVGIGNGQSQSDTRSSTAVVQPGGGLAEGWQI